jgi:hypothetical protein
MFKRLVRGAIAEGRVSADAVAMATDDTLIHDLQQSDRTGLARALRERRLAKRALDLPATALPDRPGDWATTDPDVLEAVENRLAVELGLEPGHLLLDLPDKPGMLDVDLPLVRRDGSVVRLAGPAAGAFLGLPRVAGELYRAARRLRVFTLAPATVPAPAIVELLEQPVEEMRARLAAGRALVT